MLRNLTTAISRSDTSGPSSMNSNTRTYTPPSLREPNAAYKEQSPDEDNDQAFEGNSSMTAHTMLASAFLKEAVTSASLGQQISPEIQSALASLEQIVHMQGKNGPSYKNTFAHQKQVPKGGLNQLPLPPTDVVVGLLRDIKGAYADLARELWMP